MDICKDRPTFAKSRPPIHDNEEAIDAISVPQILQSIIRLAVVQTGATSGAIALSHEGQMVCCATEGRIAPPLGARVDSAAGITGACVSVARIVRCDDARVESSLCRQMGIASVLALPVADSRGSVGVLELLSGKTNAFYNTPPELLCRLLDLAKIIRDLVYGGNSPGGESHVAVVHQQSPNRQITPRTAGFPVEPHPSASKRITTSNDSIAELAEVREILQDGSDGATWDNICPHLASYLVKTDAASAADSDTMREGE